MLNPTANLPPQSRQFLAELGHLFVMFRMEQKALTGDTLASEPVKAGSQQEKQPTSIMEDTTK